MSGKYCDADDGPMRDALQKVQLVSGPDCEHPYHISQWCIEVPKNNSPQKRDALTLFGCTEDITCAQKATHTNDAHRDPFCRRLCPECCVPLCFKCKLGLDKGFTNVGGDKQTSIPMALSNDNFYGYAAKLLFTKQIWWLECAASSLVWTTIMVYYLEAPYGHLMLEKNERSVGQDIRAWQLVQLQHALGRC